MRHWLVVYTTTIFLFPTLAHAYQKRKNGAASVPTSQSEMERKKGKSSNVVAAAAAVEGI